jgi:hypothetical protein
MSSNSCLEKHISNRIPERVLPPPPPVEIQDHTEYEVDAILTHRVRRGKVLYLVKWKGYDDTENTWEPVESLENTKELLKEYHNRYPTLKPPTKRRSGARPRKGGSVTK